MDGRNLGSFLLCVTRVKVKGYARQTLRPAPGPGERRLGGCRAQRLLSLQERGQPHAGMQRLSRGALWAHSLAVC